MNMNMAKRLAMATTIAAMAVPVAMAVPAQAAKGSGAVTAHGTCINGGTWKLKAKPDSTGIEWEFQVDTNRAGQIWSVNVTDNSTKVFSGKGTTVAPSGSFSIARLSTNLAGTDVISAKATRGSASCSGTVRI